MEIPTALLITQFSQLKSQAILQIFNSFTILKKATCFKTWCSEGTLDLCVSWWFNLIDSEISMVCGLTFVDIGINLYFQVW